MIKGSACLILGVDHCVLSASWCIDEDVDQVFNIAVFRCTRHTTVKYIHTDTFVNADGADNAWTSVL